MDIDQQVLAAYQIEHKEHLLRMRSALLALDSDPGPARQQCLDEACRMAHTLKGGARVCNLQPAVELGHGLETVFAQLRDGQLDWDADVALRISRVLDGLEDWMSALADTASPPLPSDAQQALTQLLPTAISEDSSAAGRSTTLQQQLRASFQSECPAYLEGLRTAVAAGADAPRSDEPVRLAHNLWASAKAADLPNIERVGRCLERLLGRLRDGTLSYTPQTRDMAEQACALIDETLTESPAGDIPPQRLAIADLEERVSACERGSALLAATDSATAQRSMPPGGEGRQETVRLRADSLDRLLESNGRLLAESLRHDQITREITELRRTIDLMVRERDAIRRLATDALSRLASIPEFRRLARYFESVDRQVLRLAQCVRQLSLRQKRSAWLLGACGRRIQADIRQARMVSADSLFQGFAKMVRDLARSQDKQVVFQFVGGDVLADRMVLQALKDPVMHMLRNAVSHGIEGPADRIAKGQPAQASVSLTVRVVRNHLHVRVADDGVGLDLTRVAEVAAQRGIALPADGAGLNRARLARLIFEPGFSTCDSVNELSGRGMGLSVVHEAVKRLQGDVQLVERPGPGTEFLLAVPLSVCSHRLLLVRDADQTFAVPLRAVERLLRVCRRDLKLLEGKPFVLHQNQPLPLVGLGSLLGLPPASQPRENDSVPLMILKSGPRRLAVGVESFLAERDQLVQQLDPLSDRDEWFGAILLEGGEPALVLNPASLVERATPAAAWSSPAVAAAAPRPPRTPCVLVVDDSFTTRTLEKSILEAHGYQVHVAMDGQEALLKLRSGNYDLVISDIEMPRLDGFGLLEEMKQQPQLANVPVILVTSRDRQEDQQRGLELGAEAYIVKRKFDHQDLLNTIQQIL